MKKQINFILSNVAIFFLTFSAFSCTNSKIEDKINLNASQTNSLNEHSTKDDTIKKIIKTNEQWKEQLTEKEYYVLRKEGTERAYYGKYWDNQREGIYHCGGCDLPLFNSSTKFKSGTGWPSFYKPINDQVITEVADNSNGWSRVEVVCTRCEGHLGHVFEDGPKPTGLRYCLNSAALDFKEK